MPTKKSKHKGKRNTTRYNKPLIFCEEGQYYAKILKPLGEKRFKIQLNGKKPIFCIGKLRGSIKRGDKVVDGGLVIITKREFEGNSCKIVDIIHNYTPDQIIKVTKTEKLIFPELLDESLMIVKNTSSCAVEEKNEYSVENIGFDFEDI